MKSEESPSGWVKSSPDGELEGVRRFVCYLRVVLASCQGFSQNAEPSVKTAAFLFL